MTMSSTELKKALKEGFRELLQEFSGFGWSSKGQQPSLSQLMTPGDKNISVIANAVGPYAGVTEWVVSVDFLGNPGQNVVPAGAADPWLLFLKVLEGYDRITVPASQVPGLAGGSATSAGFFPQGVQVPLYGGCFQFRGTSIKADLSFDVTAGITPTDVQWGLAIKPGRLVRSIERPRIQSATNAIPAIVGTPRRAVGVRVLPSGGPLVGDTLQFKTGTGGTTIMTVPSPAFAEFMPIPAAAMVCQYNTTSVPAVNVLFEFEVYQ